MSSAKWANDWGEGERRGRPVGGRTSRGWPIRTRIGTKTWKSIRIRAHEAAAAAAAAAAALER